MKRIKEKTIEIIEKIEIKNFRSFGNRVKEKVKIINIKSLNIISGANDSGKSNILRALNLFFNKHTDHNSFFDFEKDFFKKEIIDDDDIQQQMTTIKIHFFNPKNKDKNKLNSNKVFLPEKFWVSRKFKSNCEYSNYDQTSGVEVSFKKEKGDNFNPFLKDEKIKPPIIASLKNQLTNFLSSISFHYVPAIKDSTYFYHLYGELQLTLWKEKNSDLLSKKDDFENSIQLTTESLMNEFKSIVNINQDFVPLFKLPKDLISLFKTLDINTGKVDLTLRGDGIQAKLIPEILYFIAKKEKSLTANNTRTGVKVKKYFIWGFEEPENSYEYRNAQLLADRFKDLFIKDIQIFLTTHSFNFLSINSLDTSTYRVWKDDSIDSSRISFIKQNESGELNLDKLSYETESDKLKNELGIFELNNRLEETFLKLESERESLLELKANVVGKINELRKPLIITEGKTDKRILELAWSKLYNQEIPYDIVSSGYEIDESIRAGSANNVMRTLELISNTFDKEKKLIGLFDNDKEGNEQYKGLKKSFESYDISKNTRKHLNKNIYGMLLSIPISRKIFVTENDISQRYFVIEHYFSDTVLERHKMKGSSILNSEVFKINKGKDKFSTNIESLEKLDFSDFTILFDDIKKIFE